LVSGKLGDLTNYPDHYQQSFDLSDLALHRDTIPKSAGNFFSIQIGNRVLTADNAIDVGDLAAKLKNDSDYNFIRDQVGLGDSKLELFEVFDKPAGANDNGRLISQGRDDAAVGDIYLDVSTYKKKGSGSAAEDVAATTQELAYANKRVQKIAVNFGEDANDRAFMYQSHHNVAITDIESAITALDFVDAAAKVVNESRARMGATMSRIEYTINNLMNLVENTEEAKSRVLDTDYAKESAELAKAQILAQAGTAMLAQANQSQQYVLNLLRQG
jgi:flagellin